MCVCGEGGCVCSVLPKKVFGLKVSKNRAPRKIFGSKRDQVAAG